MALWMVRGGRHGEQETVALENGLACLGYGEVPDLTSAGSLDAARELVRRTYEGSSEGQINNRTGQVYAFAHRMKEHDLIAMPLKTTSQIALGRITGPYEYRTDLGDIHHTRKVEWVRNDVPRTSFAQDLLYSLGSLLTVCRIERNNAEERVRAMILGDSDPGLSPKAQAEVVAAEGDVEPEVVADVEQMARDQIMSHIRQNFKDHDLARLVAAVLNAEGYTTKVSPPGPDGGVDILAGQGPLGFDGTHLCVQVKATQSSVDVRVFRELQGTMTNFNAAQGLLVSWGGFTRPAEEEARKSFFTVRLWDADALVNAVLEIYDKLPEEFRSELPLKRVWTLVVDEQAV